jgi:GDP-L-fucose synthase
VAVREFIRREKPDAIVLAAAKVGGINANNSSPWEFIHENLLIESNLIGSAQEAAVDRLVFLGSSCIYPRLAPQPIREDSLLTGPLEPTNEAYAIAKIAGLKLVEAATRQFGREWVSLMPTNLYGPGDNFDVSTSHVIPGMMRKFHDARSELDAGREATVKLWGTGRALREFLHVDDLAEAVALMVERRDTGLYNVGSGEEVSVRDLASLMASTVGYVGPVEWDSAFPDGTPRKLLDSSRISSLGWRPRIQLADGLASTYSWFVAEHVSAVR